ncbi:Testican-1 [Chelonia mydas]|uniref:Testican-1 n=1 Tax=Chelonia mydas TaxID=8469 RepID=M7BUV8_CHEMY|nr:Testican-1 [Chelonia mydas]
MSGLCGVTHQWLFAHVLVGFDTSILPICKDSLGWMFNKLDMNYDLLLDHSEINAIYLDKYEPCIKPLFNSCDSFKDGKLSNNEWCYCFQKPGGVFLPRCNEEGYYKATQCHGSTGQCWCVDKYGNEIAGSRKQGTVSCEEEQETSGDFGSGGSVVLLDDLEQDREAAKKDKEGKMKIHVSIAMLSRHFNIITYNISQVKLNENTTGTCKLIKLLTMSYIGKRIGYRIAHPFYIIDELMSLLIESGNPPLTWSQAVSQTIGCGVKLKSEFLVPEAVWGDHGIATLTSALPSELGGRRAVEAGEKSSSEGSAATRSSTEVRVTIP